MFRFKILLILLVLACSSNAPLVSRGLPPAEREFYIIQNGWGLTQEIKDSFKQGIPCIGMKQELVFSLYGSPDQIYRARDEETEKHKETWNYYKVENRTLVMMAKIQFDSDGFVESVSVEE